jgi:hypothetical protein
MISVMSQGKQVSLFVQPVHPGPFIDMTEPIAQALSKPLAKGFMMISGWSTQHYRDLVTEINNKFSMELKIHFCCAIVAPIVPFKVLGTVEMDQIISDWNIRWKQSHP